MHLCYVHFLFKLVAELFFNRPMDKLDLGAVEIIRLSKFNKNSRTLLAAIGRAGQSASVDNERMTAVTHLTSVAKNHLDNAFGSLGTFGQDESSVQEAAPNGENLFRLLRYFWMSYHAFGVDGVF